MEQGSQHSPATKAKIRQALKGRKLSAEHRNRIRQARVGQSHSAETRERIRSAHLGKPLSAEALAKRRRKRPPASPISPAVAAWMQFFFFALRTIRRGGPRNIGRKTIEQLAETMCLVGPPANPEARRCFKALVALLFSRVRLDWTKGRSLRRYSALLPQSSGELMKLTWTVEAAQEHFDGFAKADFSVPNFIAVATKIPFPESAEGFIVHCLEDPQRRLKTIGAIFNPNTVNFQEKRLRGLFGDLAQMSIEHMDEVLAKIQPIR